MLEKFKQFEIQNPTKIFGGSTPVIIDTTKDGDKIIIFKHPGIV